MLNTGVADLRRRGQLLRQNMMESILLAGSKTARPPIHPERDQNLGRNCKEAFEVRGAAAVR